jgi:hypothetical protein
MENASKALMIAASVLIALIVIGLLVYSYNQLKDLMGTEETVVKTEQAVEFNKQFDTYDRNNLYGSDILSIANKVCDYNIKQADEQGYEKIEMELTFKNSYTSYDGVEIIKKNKVYGATEIQNIIKTIETQISKYTSMSVGKTTIASISGYNTLELEEFFKQNNINNEDKQKEIQNNINLYLSYKTMLSTIKSQTYSASKFDYSNENGRITKMVFVQN